MRRTVTLESASPGDKNGACEITRVSFELSSSACLRGYLRVTRSSFAQSKGSRCETDAAPATVTGNDGQIDPLDEKSGKDGPRMNREPGDLLHGHGCTQQPLDTASRGAE